MSKESWLVAYERNLDDGMSEEEAANKAQDRAADIEASKIDAARDMLKERGLPS